MNSFTKMLVIGLAIDLVWILGVGKYDSYIKGGLNQLQVAALWLIVAISQTLLLFALLQNNTKYDHILLGALQGFTVYFVFNATAKVVFPDNLWPWHIAIMDTIWGTLLYAIVAMFSS